MQEIEEQINQLKQKFANIVQSLDLPKLKAEIDRLEKASGEPGFWQNHRKAQESMQKMAGLKEEIESVEELRQKLAECSELAGLMEDESGQAELNQELKQIKTLLKQLERKTYFTGPYDGGEAILSVHAGQGGTEACDWASMLLRMYRRFAEDKKWPTKTISERSGEEAGIKSATIVIKGSYAYGWLKKESGTHRLVRLSPFNADNLRHTSFAMVQVMPVLPEAQEQEIKPDDLKVTFSRSSGHGGQNVNKVSTAVHLEHIPTGLVVECQTERTQEQNRKIALSLLRSKLWVKEEEERQAKLKNLRGSQTMASWGTQIRSYVLHPYKLVKDVKTGYEEQNPDRVLDGKIDNFIIQSLKSDFV